MKKLMLLGALVALVIAGTYFKCFVCNGTGKV